MIVSWESYVNHYAPAFLRVIQYLAKFAGWLLAPIEDWAVEGMLGESDLANAVISLWNTIISVLGDYSLIELAIGGGLIVFVIITIVKWIVGIVT